MGGLAAYATGNDSEYAKREHPEHATLHQNPYRIDCYRIMTCPAFSKLTNKSQLWWDIMNPEIRTRLTHTLGVALIARTIARSLKLSEDLSEAIALGHDLGHMPFGHASEIALEGILDKGFRHEEQSVRILKYIDKTNSTMATLEGIAKHSTGKRGLNDPHIHLTNESKVVLLSDKIDNDVHDFSDLQKLKVSNWKKLPQDALAVFEVTVDDLTQNPRQAFERMRDRIISSIIRHSEVSADGKTLTIKAGENIQEAQQELHNFIYSLHDSDKDFGGRNEKALWVVETLYNHFKMNPNTLRTTDLQKSLKTATREGYKRYLEETNFDTQFCDAFCNMNDAIAIEICKDLAPMTAFKYFAKARIKVRHQAKGEHKSE